MRFNPYNHNKEGEHEINTDLIFQQLTGVDDRKWKNYDRDFLKNTVREALDHILRQKKIITVKYDGNNGDYLDGYKNVRNSKHFIYYYGINALQ
jgi:hypothetical protein